MRKENIKHSEYRQIPNGGEPELDIKTGDKIELKEKIDSGVNKKRRIHKSGMVGFKKV